MSVHKQRFHLCISLLTSIILGQLGKRCVSLPIYDVVSETVCRIDIKSGIGGLEEMSLCMSEFGESRHSDSHTLTRRNYFLPVGSIYLDRFK